MTVIADSTVRSMCTIGQEISIWCEKNHITNQELADALDVSRETVKRRSSVWICYSSIYGNTGSLVYSCISNKFVNEEGEKQNMSVH